MLGREMPANAVNNPGVVLWSIQHVCDLLMRVRLWENQLQCRFSINLVCVCIVQIEERKSVRCGGLKESGRDNTHAYEGRSAQDGIELSLAHPLDYLLEGDGGEGFYLELPQVFGIGVISILHLHRRRPGRQRVPSMANHANSPNLLA